MITSHRSRRLSWLVSLLMLVLTVTGCQESSQVARIARVENGLRPKSPRLLTPPQRIVDRMAFYKVPALSIAVIDQGELVWAKGYGTLEPGGGPAVDTETLFHGASLSKVVNAITVLRLVEDGKLGLDEDVNNKLTSWKVPEGKFNRSRPSTLRNILSHTAGFNLPIFGVGYPAIGPTPTLLQILEGKRPATNPAIAVVYSEGPDTAAPVLRAVKAGNQLTGPKINPVHRPGSGSFHYSGGGIAVTQQLLVDVTQIPYEKLVKNKVFDPLEMEDTTFEQILPAHWAERAASGYSVKGKRVNGPDRVYPAMAGAGIWTNPSDMARVVVEIQEAANGRDSAILTPWAARQMLTGHVDYPGSVIPTQVGLGLFVNGKDEAATFFHAGSHAGYRTYLVGTVKTGKGVVVMTNSDNGFDLIGEVVAAVAREYGWTDYHFVPPPPAPTTLPATAPSAPPEPAPVTQAVSR